MKQIGHLFNVGCPAESAFELGGDMTPLIHQCYHVGRDMYGLNICKQCPLYALLYPPRCIGAEARAVAGVIIVHRFYEAQVAFFDEVAETHSPVAIFLGDIDDKPQVASDKLLSGPGVVFFYDQFAQRTLLLDRQQRSLVDLLEIFLYGDIKSYNLLLPIRCSLTVR